MRRRWVLDASLGVSAAMVVVGALVVAPDGDDPKPRADALGVEPTAAAFDAQPEPVDGTVPTAPPEAGKDYELMCPGLELDPELIPPQFEADVHLIPDPEPFEICLLLERAAR